MSMLSSQAKELRILADKLRRVQLADGADYVGTLEILYLSTVAMHEAADTIESMRDKLQDLQGVDCGECKDRAEAFTLLTNGTVCVGSKQLVAKIDELQSRLNKVDLGGGECKLVEVDSYINDREETIYVFECSVCGETCEHVNGIYPKCPHCGRKAVK